MDVLTRRDYLQLADSSASPCVSVYMPVEVTGRETRQNATRLKNLLVEAENQLAEKTGDRVAARQLLGPAHAKAASADFWDKRSPGLAQFIAPGVLCSYWLPTEVKESLQVGVRFVLRPLLPTVSQESSFYLLALSQNLVRLLRVSKFSATEISLPDLPQDMERTLNYSGADRGAQLHSATSFALGKQAAVFHGQGGLPDTAKEDLTTFFRKVDHVVARYLKKYPAPLMLACVDYLAPIYRRITWVPHVMDPIVDGNPDHLTADELQHRAWPSFGLQHRLDLESSLEELAGFLEAGKATTDIKEIVLAAYDGRIETLFVDPLRTQWGMFEPSERVVDVQDLSGPDDHDLIESAVAETLRHRGNVRCAAESQLPTAEPIAALLRNS